MRTITCFDGRTSGTFLIIASVSRKKRKRFKKRKKISDTAWLGKQRTKKWRNMKMGTITCFGDRTSGVFLIHNCLGLSDEDNSVSRTDNFVNVNVFSIVTSPRVLSYRCVLHYFLTMLVGFDLNLTFGSKPQVSGIKIVTVQKRSIFKVQWLIATLILNLKHLRSPKTT